MKFNEVVCSYFLCLSSSQEFHSACLPIPYFTKAPSLFKDIVVSWCGGGSCDFSIRVRGLGLELGLDNCYHT